MHLWLALGCATAGVVPAPQVFGAKQGAVRQLQDEGDIWNGQFNHDCTEITNAKLNASVIRAWAKLKRIDTNGDDAISWDEYHHVYVAPFEGQVGFSSTLLRNKDRFHEMDSGGDGSITRSELCPFIAAKIEVQPATVGRPGNIGASGSADVPRPPRVTPRSQIRGTTNVHIAPAAPSVVAAATAVAVAAALVVPAARVVPAATMPVTPPAKTVAAVAPATPVVTEAAAVPAVVATAAAPATSTVGEAAGKHGHCRKFRVQIRIRCNGHAYQIRLCSHFVRK